MIEYFKPRGLYRRIVPKVETPTATVKWVHDTLARVYREMKHNRPFHTTYETETVESFSGGRHRVWRVVFCTPHRSLAVVAADWANENRTAVAELEFGAAQNGGFQVIFYLVPTAKP